MRLILVSAGLLLPLGVDTLALAAALGLAGLKPRERLRVSLLFAAFEAGMPIVGLFAGLMAGRLLGDWAGYLGVGLILVAGLLLLRPSQDEAGETRRAGLLASARGLALVNLGLSISVDELTVGVSAGLLGLSVPLTVIWLGVQAFVATQVGLRAGSRLGEAARESAERAAGVALILVAMVLLALRIARL